MKKDTSKLIDLDSILNPKVEETKQPEIISESVITTPEVQVESINVDAILSEWAWRCDKGYPDYNNKSDMIKLQEVLDEMGIALPFKRVTEVTPKKKSTVKPAAKASKSKASSKEEALTKAEIKFMQLVNGEAPGQTNDPEIPETVKKSILAVFKQYPKKQKIWIDQFQQMKSVAEFVKSKGEPWREFFDCISPSGMGRGEMMAVMAIEGAKSGGTGEKDLKVAVGKPWEVKEDPTGIRMAQSGFAGRFRYINELRKFYELLTTIELNDQSKDSDLKIKLQKVFGNEETATKMYQILTKNFRGDGYKVSEKDKKAAEKDNKPLITKDNFFERMVAAAEYPTGVIDLHYDGFKQLRDLRATIISQKELVNNAKLVLRTATSDEDSQYYISAEDAEEIQMAGQKGKEVRIKVTTPIKEDFKEFLHAMLAIVRHPFVKNPDEIIADFIDRKNDYFSHIQGFVYYLKRNPTPIIGRGKDFIIYGISQSMGKMESKEYAGSNSPFINAQLGKG